MPGGASEPHPGFMFTHPTVLSTEVAYHRQRLVTATASRRRARRLPRLGLDRREI